MATLIRIALIDTDPVLRAALVEQFGASSDFDIRGAGTVAEAVSASNGDLHHIDAVLLAGEAASEESLGQLAAAGFSGPVAALGASASLKGAAVLTLDRPIRFTTLASAIRGALHDHARSDDARFRIGPYEFQPSDRTLTAEGRETVRLTDKEAGILRYLHRAGRPVARDELLGEVWGYNSGVTTHTLETHIYRLRQKMEPGSDDARLLVTEESGYTLAAAGEYSSGD